MHRLLGSLSLALIPALFSHYAVAQQQFDGRWSVEAIPEKGACKRAHRYAVVIDNGTVRNSASRKMRVSVMGGLEASGRVRGSVQGNKTRVDVTGSLSGRSGSGNWASIGRVNCSGRWAAEKRS